MKMLVLFVENSKKRAVVLGLSSHFLTTHNVEIVLTTGTQHGAFTMDHIHQAWEWWYNGGRVPFFGKAVCILCIIFVLTFSKGSAFALL